MKALFKIFGYSQCLFLLMAFSSCYDDCSEAFLYNPEVENYYSLALYNYSNKKLTGVYYPQINKLIHSDTSKSLRIYLLNGFDVTELHLMFEDNSMDTIMYSYKRSASYNGCNNFDYGVSDIKVIKNSIDSGEVNAYQIKIYKP